MADEVGRLQINEGVHVGQEEVEVTPVGDAGETLLCLEWGYELWLTCEDDGMGQH